MAAANRHPKFHTSNLVFVENDHKLPLTCADGDNGLELVGDDIANGEREVLLLPGTGA